MRLLEGDKDFESKVDEGTLTFVNGLRDEMQQAHNEDITVTIARGRHSTADLIANAVLVRKVHKPTFAEKFGDIATRPQTGYPLLFLLIGGMLALIFYVGGYLSNLITTFFEDIVFPPIYGILNAQVVNVFIASAIKSTLLASRRQRLLPFPTSSSSSFSWRFSKTLATSRGWRRYWIGRHTSSDCTAGHLFRCCLAMGAACPQLWRRERFLPKRSE